MLTTEQILRKEYPNIEDLRKYTSKYLSSCCENTVIKGSVVPKGYKFNLPNLLEYDELIQVVLHYKAESDSNNSNNNLSLNRQRKKPNIRTISDYKDSPIKFEHIFKCETNQNLVIIFGILFLIYILYFIIKIFRKN